MQGPHRVSSRYNWAGQRLALTSSLGVAVELERDDYGEVAQMQAASWQARFERGMYGTSAGQPTTNTAAFKWLKYEGHDPVYKK